MKPTKNEWISSGVTACIMAIVVLCLFFFGYTSDIPETEEGLSVSLGSFIVSSETSESLPQHSATAQPAPNETPSDPFLTQNDESVYLDAEAKKKKEQEERLKEEERRRKEEEAKAAQIQSQVANVFGASRSQTQPDNGTGDTPAGRQGQENGSENSSNTIGSGDGSGSFSLDGRSLRGSLPRPNYVIQDEGIVVVRIEVNPQGNVIRASIELNGTNTSNAQLRKVALEAAQQARFNAINGTDNQTGTITYRFKLK